MSHDSNTELIERAQEDFASAKNQVEREAVVERLRKMGFDTQADYLAQWVVDGGVDTSDELREREAFDTPEPRQSGEGE